MSDDGSRQSKRSGATRMKKTDKLKKSLEESKKEDSCQESEKQTFQLSLRS